MQIVLGTSDIPKIYDVFDLTKDIITRTARTWKLVDRYTGTPNLPTEPMRKVKRYIFSHINNVDRSFQELNHLEATGKFVLKHFS